jgi:hypothetical protein
VALRILCLTGRSDKRPGGARATKGGLDQSARAGGRLESLAGGRSASRIETASLIASSVLETTRATRLADDEEVLDPKLFLKLIAKLWRLSRSAEKSAEN